MLDQSFSIKNLRTIFDLENRKGTFLEELYFPNLVEQTTNIRRQKTKVLLIRKEISTLKNQKKTPAREKLLEEANYKIEKELSEIKKLKSQKQISIDEALEKLRENLINIKINTELSKTILNDGKPAYTLNNSKEAFFAFKQIQYNLKKTFSITPPDRQLILNQLKQFLLDTFPKVIVRTDITSFYESLDQEILEEAINRNKLLDTVSKKLIRSTLKNFHTLSQSTKGIPRGVGVSSLLSEIYMHKFDEMIKNQPETIYYARYVDDIIIIISDEPKISGAKKIHLSNIKNRIKKVNLQLNKNKTFTYQVLDEEQELDYLGYKFIFSKANVEIELSDQRYFRYKKKIVISFKRYEANFKKSERKAKIILDRRIKFLTSNTQLINNKRRAMTGIYFSNNLLTRTQRLNELDTFLYTLSSRISCSRTKKRLQKHSFVAGFKEKKFSKYSTKVMAQIVKGWKHEL